MLLGVICNMEGLFKCPLCEVACAYKSTLLSHVNQHDGYPLTCIKCCTSFKNKFAYDYHLYAELCKKSLQCPECPQLFNNRRHFTIHVEGHKKNNCKYCDVKLTTKKELIQHMAKEHNIKLQRANYQCKYCERCFVKQVTLYNHYNHHANGKFVCQGCGMFLDTKEELESHRERHEEERPWKCTRCATTFSRRQQYVIHMVSHEKYQCKTCNMGFAAKATLQEHSRACQNQSGKESQHECPECGKIFSRESQLKLHLKAHTGEEAYTCLVCKEGFQTASEYNQHMENTCQKRKKLEDHEKPYEYTHDFLLVEDMNRIHGASQIYKCRYCDLTTNSRANMTRHLALHTEKRRFVCDQCGAAFHAKTTLKDHCISVHSEQRDFSCDTCSKTFKLQSDLRRHIRAHSEIRPFKCQNCNQSYKRVSHLRRHEEATHGTFSKRRRVERLEQNEKGAFVPANEESKSSVDADAVKDEETPAVTSETQQWSVPSSSQGAVFASPVLSLVDADSGKVITMQEICNDAQILASSGNLSTTEILSLPADDQVAAIVSCPDPTLDSFQGGNVIEVTYDLGFTTSQTLTTVLPNAESRLVFATPIAVSLDANQTVLAVSQIQPSETLEGKVQLLEMHASKLPNTIFIEDIKLESMEEPMLLESTEPAPHITIENFTALQSDVGEATELDTMLQLPDEVLSSESLLRKRLMSGPKLKPAPPTAMSQCDNMSSIVLPSALETNSSLHADPSTLSASSIAVTPVDISQTSNLISIPSTVHPAFVNSDSTISSLSAGKTTEHLDASKSPLTVYGQDTEMSVQDSRCSHEISSLAMESPITLDEDEPTTVTLSALPVDQAAPESDETVTMSTLSVDALGVSISDEDLHPGCTISIQQQDGSTDVVMASLDMHTDPSLSQVMK